MSAWVRHAQDALSADRTLTRAFGAVESLPEERFTPVHCHVLKHWQRMRGDRPALRSADFDPYHIRQALPNVALWELDEGGYRCRLAGTEVEDNAGGSMKGILLASIPCALIGEAIEEFDRVRDERLPCFVERTMGWAGRPLRYYRHLLLPLVDDDNVTQRLLSAMTFHSILDAPTPLYD